MVRGRAHSTVRPVFKCYGHHETHTDTTADSCSGAVSASQGRPTCPGTPARLADGRHGDCVTAGGRCFCQRVTGVSTGHCFPGAVRGCTSGCGSSSAVVLPKRLGKTARRAHIAEPDRDGPRAGAAVGGYRRSVASGRLRGCVAGARGRRGCRFGATSMCFQRTRLYFEGRLGVDVDE